MSGSALPTTSGDAGYQLLYHSLTCNAGHLWSHRPATSSTAWRLHVYNSQARGEINYKECKMGIHLMGMGGIGKKRDRHFGHESRECVNASYKCGLAYMSAATELLEKADRAAGEKQRLIREEYNDHINIAFERVGEAVKFVGNESYDELETAFIYMDFAGILALRGDLDEAKRYYDLGDSVLSKIIVSENPTLKIHIEIEERPDAEKKFEEIKQFYEEAIEKMRDYFDKEGEVEKNLMERFREKIDDTSSSINKFENAVRSIRNGGDNSVTLSLYGKYQNINSTFDKRITLETTTGDSTDEKTNLTLKVGDKDILELTTDTVLTVNNRKRNFSSGKFLDNTRRHKKTKTRTSWSRSRSGGTS